MFNHTHLTLCTAAALLMAPAAWAVEASVINCSSIARVLEITATGPDNAGAIHPLAASALPPVSRMGSLTLCPWAEGNTQGATKEPLTPPSPGETRQIAIPPYHTLTLPLPAGCEYRMVLMQGATPAGCELLFKRVSKDGSAAIVEASIHAQEGMTNLATLCPDGMVTLNAQGDSSTAACSSSPLIQKKKNPKITRSPSEHTKRELWPDEAKKTS